MHVRVTQCSSSSRQIGGVLSAQNIRGAQGLKLHR
jgi:hypothetical protein